MIVIVDRRITARIRPVWADLFGQPHRAREGNLMPMSAEETRQQVIGLITAGYTTMHEGGNAEDFVEMTAPLLADLLSGDIDIQVDGTEDVQSLVHLVAQQTVKGLEPAVETVIATFLSAFIILAQEYEATNPDKGVLEILQDIALSDEDPEDPL